MPVIRPADFRPAWWLPGPHAQTVWAALVRRKPRIALRRERLETPDGDFIDVDWTVAGGGPLVLILHGLEGSSASHYARGLLRAVAARGWRGAVMHFRGCSGEPNRRAYSYTSGETADLDWLVALLHAREPDAPIACVGYSLGGNVLLKWLGEQGDRAPLAAAVAVSVPFLLETAARRLARGFSRLYQWHLLRALRASYRRKFAGWTGPLPVEFNELDDLVDFYQYDHRITAPLHGYRGAYDYYRRASSRQFLHAIRIPTLVLHARDDPFMLRATVPDDKELSASVILELSPRGGHVGFVSGALPWRPEYWLERRIPEFLAGHWPGDASRC